MAIYCPICRGEKLAEIAHLHREMAFTVLKHVAALTAGALAALSADFTYAAVLNQNLGIRPERAEPRAEATPLMVPAPVAVLAPGGGPAAVIPVQAKPASRPVGISEPVPSAAEIVGKLLAPKASDPNVPLPHPDLQAKSEAGAPLTGPTLYGRSEPGGGILGLRVPIPVERSGSAGTTRYGFEARPPEGPAIGAPRSR
jgi:hypothetical protein